MIMKKLFCACVALALGMSFASTVWGQATGSFSGTVLDKTGSPILGATVTATSQGTGISRSAKTDDSGHYLIPLLPVSIYTLRVEFTGFQTAESKDLRLQVDEARELNFTLSPSAVTAQVEVSASAVAVETTNPSLGQVITSQEVQQLPLNGRDFVQLATLTPGATQETNTSSFFNGAPSSEVSARGSFSLSVGGSRPNVTDWLLDGNDNNELTAGGIAILSSIDSIQEFKVLTYNYSAEYGTRAGPTVLVTTKAGGNAFHGSLFEFVRNTSLDAKSFFASSPEKFNLNQFGGSIGGPIRKNKSFFFIDGEQKYQRHGVTFTGLVPSDDMRNGDFTNDPLGNPRPVGTIVPTANGTHALVNPNMAGASTNPNMFPNVYFQCDASGKPIPANSDGSQTPVVGGSACNKIPANLINPIAAQLVALYPHANTINQSGFFNFVNEPVRKLDETKFDVRLDHNFSSADNAFARFSYDQAVSYVPGGGGVGNFTESFFFASNQGLINHARNIALSETHVFSPNTVNQVSGGYNRIFNYITSQGTGSCEAAKLGIPGANLDCGTGTCPPTGISCGLTIAQVLGGYFSVGDRGFSPFQGGTNIFSINDSLDMIRGKHDIRVGMGIRANQMNTRTEGFQDGFWTLSGGWVGDAEADLLLGLTSLAIHDQTFKGPTTGRRWKIFRPFVQDDWRVTKNIVLNLGFAWNLTTPISEVANRQADFDPATGKFLVAGQGANKWAGIQFDKTALEPRIGLAWKPWGSDKTAVRAGYAIYHDSSWNQGAQGLWQNPPYYAESDSFPGGSYPTVSKTGTVTPGTCTFPTAACAKPPLGQTPTGLSLSAGFPIFTGPPSQPNFTDFTGTILAQNTNFKLGDVQQFNINVERQLPGEIVLTAGYAGSRGHHILIDGNNLNVATPSACGGVVPGYTLGCGPGGTALPPPYAPTFFNTVLNTTDQGNAHYNSLQIKAETKSSRYGIYALIGYTYSRTYDNGFADGLGSNYGATYYPLPGFNHLDWALSGLNLNNNFIASVIYDLPFGEGKHFGSGWSGPANALLGNWQLTVIEKITSGFPVFVVDSSNNCFSPSSTGVCFLNNNGASLTRPNELSDPNKGGGGPGCPAQVHTVANWFNPCAFAHAIPGELGNASRTPLSGPDFVNTDFSVIKQFALPWENMGVNFRAEFFNLFNHPQFGTPNAGAGLGIPDINGGPGFGAINSTVNGPRLIQFGLKLTF
jgi:Carboxypeptidase regulatory-like domain